MKTTLKTLICTVLCCAASAAFAAPAPTTTAMHFKGAAGCAGADVGSVMLSGNSNPDVYIQSTTTVTSSGLPVTSGFAQVQIATLVDDVTHVATPTSAGTAGVCWIAIMQTSVDSSGQACNAVDLEGLSSIMGLTDCDDNPVTLANANCDSGDIGFRIHYAGGAPDFGNSFSPANDLGIDCAECEGFNITDPAVEGAGNPCPGSHHCWTYTMNVQNCTGSNLTNVKIQGGTSAWLDAAQTVTITPSAGWTITPKPKGRNNIVWTLSGGSIADGDTVTVTVNVCGTVSSECDATEFLSGPWSATGTKTSDNSKVSTTHNNRASFFIDCSEDCQPTE